MKRFTIIAKDFREEKVLTTEALTVVQELQSKKINHIELIDNEKQTVTLYRKGTQDKNYFVRTKDLQTPTEGDSDTTAISDTGNNQDKVSELSPVDDKRKNRSVKK
ncbi:hypothetical protein HX071_08730 [Myroides marinus]|uniref:hypothetical protein n=1 Tax=Myroides marinus TaxID=703342 RepID=UPI0025774A33|nr:hypothetical protein [Myroides marinus]MDM1502289.1 hypothetical protein [Myroides marinus]